jgi:hypothetical protein
MTQLWDPLSGYLPETQDFLDLCEFISVKSGLEAKIGAEFHSLPFSYKISLSLAEVMSTFESLTQSEENVIGLAVARFWFSSIDRTYRVNSDLVAHLSDLSGVPVRELCDFFDFEGVSAEFLRSIPILESVPDRLFECMFATVPDDIAHAIHAIELRFAGFAASMFRKELDDPALHSMTLILWKIAIIASEVGVIDAILETVEEHMALNIFHGPIFTNCQKVISVVKSLVREAERIKAR